MTWRDTHEHARLRLEALRLAHASGRRDTLAGPSYPGGSETVALAEDFYLFLSKELREQEAEQEKNPPEVDAQLEEDVWTDPLAEADRRARREPFYKVTPASEEEVREVLKKAKAKAAEVYKDPVARQLAADGLKAVKRFLR